MVHYFRQLRILQPEIIAMEQVTGYKAHEHYPATQALAQWAGYELIEEHVSELSEIAAARRPRWLGIYMRQDLVQEHKPKWASWVKWLNNTPATLGAHEELPTWECTTFEPSYKTAEMYMEATLMPGPIRPWTKHEIVQYRIPGLHQKQPAFMHAYGNQHSLPHHLLHSKGLLGFFVQQGNTFRFWAPWEQAYLHIQVGDIILLKPATLSWQSLGNMIAIPHAVLQLMNVHRIQRPQEDFPEAKEVFTKLLASRATVKNTTRLQDDYAWYIAKQGRTEQLQLRLSTFVTATQWQENKTGHRTLQLPHQAWWHPQQGLVAEAELPTQLYHDTYEHLQIDEWEIQLSQLGEAFGPYHIQQADPTLSIMRVWESRFLPKHDKTADIQTLQWNCSKITLLPAEDTSTTAEQAHPRADYSITILAKQDNQIYIYELPKQTQWKVIREQHPSLAGKWQDQYGPLISNQYPTPLMVIHNQPPPAIRTIDRNFQMSSLHAVKVEISKVYKADIIKIHLRGPQHDLQQTLHLWDKAFSPEWLAFHGIAFHYQDLAEKGHIYLLRPVPKHLQNQQPMTPTTAITQIMPIRLIQTGLSHYQNEELDIVPLIIKRYGHVLGEARMAPTDTMEGLLQLLQHSFAIQEYGQQPALISFGKRCTETTTVQDLIQRKATTTTTLPRQVIICQVVDPLLGGGPEAGSKQAFRQMIQAKTASMLMEFGMNLTTIPPVITKLEDQIGHTRLHHLHHAEAAATRYDTFAQLCKDCGIELPNDKPTLSITQEKFRKMARTTTHTTAEDFEVDSYLLQTGFFQNADRTAATVLAHFQPRTSGIFLTNKKQTTTWLTTKQSISEDELAMFVVGTNLEVTLPAEEVTAPAMDPQGRAVLLQGTLVQFGSKAILCPEAKDQQGENPTVQVCAVVVYKEDMDDPTWQGILNSPVKTVKALLALQGFAEVIGRPWSRIYKAGEVLAPAHLADSVQFHAEVHTNRMEQLLARSGFIKIYLIPKDGTGRPSSNYKIIWNVGAPQQLDSMTAGTAGVAGLVKTKKGYGLKVKKEAYGQFWKLLHPDQPLPPDQDFLYIYRVQPFPNGTTKKAIIQWGKTNQ